MCNAQPKKNFLFNNAIPLIAALDVCKSTWPKQARKRKKQKRGITKKEFYQEEL